MTSIVQGQRSILVANDHEWAARSLETILNAEGYGVERAFTAAQAIERASVTSPDACILDVQLPDSDGMTLCGRLRATLGHSAPILLTTAGPSGRKERIAAYEAGAWEFFGHPLDGESLLLKLRTYLGAAAVVDDLRRASLIDDVTGLYSRRGLLRRGQELVADAARRHGGITCVVLRADAPELEATLGEALDLARVIGELFRSTGRAADAIGRVGPLDFGLIASGVGESGARQLMRRLNDLAATIQTPEGPGRFAFRAAFHAIDDVSEGNVDLEGLLQQTTDAVNGPNGLAAIAHR